jgi:type IV pilus assembly protein PilY1
VLLGDIVNAAPAYVGAVPTFAYPDFLCDKVDNQGDCIRPAPEVNKQHSSFRAGFIATPRTPALYVGANDGMLHAFNASKDTIAGGGNEYYAYVPSMVVGKMGGLARPSYAHEFYVDGSPTVMDAFVGSQWRTILVAGLGAGGQGVYALDVTTPGTPRALWEFSDANDLDVGFTYSRPNVVRLPDGRWIALFGKGYDNTEADGNVSTTGNPVLYALSVEDGAILYKIQPTDTGTPKSTIDPKGLNRPNGLSTVAPVDSNGDGIVDYAYAGDLFGNLWRFSFTYGRTDSNTVVAYQRVFATGGQPITVRPQVVRHPSGAGFVVLFGTGKYFETDDAKADDQDDQAFYGIWDDLTSTPPARKSNARLLQQTILAEQKSTINGFEYEYRVTSETAIDWTTYAGWFMTLKYPTNGDNEGERSISDPIVRGSRVVFTTLLPNPDPCDFGGDGWLMELSAVSGARLSVGEAPFLRRTSTGEYTGLTVNYTSGNGEVEVAPSGRKSLVGIVPTPAVLARSGTQREFKYLSGSRSMEGTKLNVEVVEESAEASSVGRKSWSQLFK